MSRKESKSVHSASSALHFNLPFRERGPSSFSPGNMGEPRAWFFSDVAMLVSAPREQDAPKIISEALQPTVKHCSAGGAEAWGP